ncbi:hypothetical protein GCM10011316_23150 [Roseibium aquae]|uniref:PilZ domain-containing protein n=1 Tax=Roseibium aquae TaxID=1323746 RepID=A0A916TKX8_9HYPH|nr:hypothetical protein [Roseibium aquae]GGB50383.1 hypothetical protein GCM10011316_23150 [Roseibium aquae]
MTDPKGTPDRHQDTGQRHTPAPRTRLRKGRIATLSDEPVSDCTLFDVEEGTIGITLPQNIQLPNGYLLYDEREHTVGIARTSWRTGLELGVVFNVTPMPVSYFRKHHAKALKEAQAGTPASKL